VQTGVASQRSEALLGPEIEEKLGQLDVMGIGHDLGPDRHPPSACRRESLQRLPRGRRDAALVASDRRLRGVGALGEGALGKPSGEAQLSYECLRGARGFDT